MAAVAAGREIAGLGTTEDAWLGWLEAQAIAPVDAAALVPAGRRAVVVAPHPDDEVLAVGGLLMQLASLSREILIVAVTDGSASHPGSTEWSAQRLAVERPLESRRAWNSLALPAGVATSAVRLGLPDGGLQAACSALARTLAPLLRSTDVVFTTWRHDGHPDHEATGKACAAAAACCGARLIEVPVWAWHWAEPGDPRLPWHRASRLALDAAASAMKRTAVNAFASQLVSDPSTGAGPILRSTTVQRAHRPFEIFFS